MGARTHKKALVLAVLRRQGGPAGFREGGEVCGEEGWLALPSLGRCLGEGCEVGEVPQRWADVRRLPVAEHHLQLALRPVLSLLLLLLLILLLLLLLPLLLLLLLVLLLLLWLGRWEHHVAEPAVPMHQRHRHRGKVPLQR